MNMKLSELLNQKIEMSDLLEELQSIRKLWSSIKIVHLCTQDFGGAGRAAYRLHKGLQLIGVDSTMLVVNKKSGDPSVKVLPADFSGDPVFCSDMETYISPVWLHQRKKTFKFLSDCPNRPKGLELFTGAISDINLNLVKEIRDADVINLHWVAWMMDYPSAAAVMRNKPVVWTLHDMNPFTGGCHYAGDCLKYKKNCGSCPQLGSNNVDDLSKVTWQYKFQAYKALRINIVTPSRWLGKCAFESKLFSTFPIDIIPYGFPLDVFKPYDKAEVRKNLNIPNSAKVILFGADSITNARKGFKYLLDAISGKLSLKSDQDYFILTFGNLPKEETITSKYPVRNLGFITDEYQLARVYSAADVFVIPSLEDNLPNTVVEAMACGVPVVGFDIGGIPDMINHKETGFLVKPKDVSGLMEGIDWVISSYDSLNFVALCREKVEKEYALEIQAKAYSNLYERILQNHAK